MGKQLFLTDKSSYSKAAELRNEFSSIHKDISDFLLAMLCDDPSRRKSAESLLSHEFIKMGRRPVERQRVEARLQGIQGAGGGQADTVESLRAQVAQLQQEREVLQSVIL